MSEKGYVPLRRGLLEHLPTLPANDFKVYGYLLMKAKNTGLGKGAYATTTRAMADDLGMDRESVIASVRRLETRRPKPFIEVDRAKNQHALTVYKILRFDPAGAGRESQPATDSAGRESRPPHRPAHRPATQPKQGVFNELKVPDREEREENTLSCASRFDDWWETYPRKLKKPAAAKAFLRAIRTPADFELLMENTRLWIAREFCEREPRYIPHPSTFLNSDDWREPPEGPPEPKRTYTEAELIALSSGGKVQ
jgi:hypothetical protein